MTRRQIGLRQFVREHGGQEKAAHKIGVAFATLNRWLKRHFKPDEESARKLRAVGVRIG